jgi:shikimate 5-dehydrogenase
LGALVTTHKIGLRATRDIFDDLDHFVSLMGEVSSISKQEGRLLGRAKDPISSGLALEQFLPAQHWERTHAHLFIMGAGGSSTALCSYLMRREHGENRPARIFVSSRSTPRLAEMKGGLPPCSLVVNATGLGRTRRGLQSQVRCRSLPMDTLGFQLPWRPPFPPTSESAGIGFCPHSGGGMAVLHLWLAFSRRRGLSLFHPV